MTNSSKRKKIASISFNSEKILQDQNFEVWHEMSSPLFDSQPIKTIKSFGTSAIAYQVNNLVFTNRPLAKIFRDIMRNFPFFELPRITVRLGDRQPERAIA
jgi:hypothetical protein